MGLRWRSEVRRLRAAAAVLAVTSVATVGCAAGGGAATSTSARRPTSTRSGSSAGDGALAPTTAPSSVPPATSAPETTTTSTTAPAPPPTWVLGGHPLPELPDGTGEVQPTPPALVRRALPTVDVLAPPADGAFHATASRIRSAVRRRMGETWSSGCPVGLDQLRYLTVTFRGFDLQAHTGELVVNASVADDVITVFHRLFDAGFPIEEMRLPTSSDLHAPPTGDGNNTAAYVCRPARGTSTWSAHAYGLAVDVNPFQNPYSKDDRVLPELASAYLDRSDVRPGMILPGDEVTAAFASIGWTWGGTWHRPVDRMHFSPTGR